jgi:ribose transport system substrate-binding protein
VKIAANTFGAGAYALDEIQGWTEYAAALFGCDIDVANNEFTADKVVAQCEGQMASNPDVAVYMLQIPTTTEPCMDAFENAGVYYAWNSTWPDDEKVQQRCFDSEYFCGGINNDPYLQGQQMGEFAIEEGCKTAIITAAAVGDYNHDNRCQGFTDAFEAGGGKVLQVAHSSDPTEAVQKTNDLLSAQGDADCVYGSGGDYLSAAVSCLETRTDVNQEMKVYGTDVDPTLIPLIQEGKVFGMNGSLGVQGSLALCLAINAYDGHRIEDENGKPIYFDNFESAIITADNADLYMAGYENGTSWVGDENYLNLLYRYNPDVSAETFNEFLENYAAISAANAAADA